MNATETLSADVTALTDKELAQATAAAATEFGNAKREHQRVAREDFLDADCEKRLQALSGRVAEADARYQPLVAERARRERVAAEKAAAAEAARRQAEFRKAADRVRDTWKAIVKIQSTRFRKLCAVIETVYDEDDALAAQLPKLEAALQAELDTIARNFGGEGWTRWVDVRKDTLRSRLLADAEEAAGGNLSGMLPDRMMRGGWHEHLGEELYRRVKLTSQVIANAARRWRS